MVRASFFSTGTTSLPMIESAKYEKTLPECGACRFYEGCKSPKLKSKGKGKQDILIINDALTKDEDAQGKHLTGQNLETLVRVLRKNGIELDRDCVLTSSLICTPNNVATAKINSSLDHCRPNITNLIKELKPKVIITLGFLAAKSLVTHLWKKDKTKSIEPFVGWAIPTQKIKGTWVIPTYHPRDTLDKNAFYEISRFEKHIALAIRCLKKDPPKYKKPRVVHLDDNIPRIKRILRRIIEDGKPVAFDYETNMKKPDNSNARIDCMSICNGKKSWVFMNFPEIKKMWIRFLKSDVPKVGFNTKFETRWSRKIFGVRIKNWIWDGMISAHVLDCRDLTTSLKFQSFVRFGTMDWDSHISKYLRTEEKGQGSYTENRIKDIPKDELLEYCGIDSWEEYKVWQSQSAELERRCK